MTEASYNSYLTEDLKTCKTCEVTQSKTRMHQRYTAPSRKPGRMGSLVVAGNGNFKRLPDIPPEAESEKDEVERLASAYFCNDVEQCTKNQIERALTDANDVSRVLTSTLAYPDPVISMRMNKALEKAREKLKKRKPKRSKKSTKVHPADRKRSNKALKPPAKVRTVPDHQCISLGGACEICGE